MFSEQPFEKLPGRGVVFDHQGTWLVAFTAHFLYCGAKSRLNPEQPFGPGWLLCDKFGNKRNGPGQVLLLGEARPLPRLERVIAVDEPLDPDGRREQITTDILSRTEHIARSLHDENGRAESGEMGRPCLLGAVGRMEGIAEADEAADLQLV